MPKRSRLFRENRGLPEFVRVKCARGHVYYYFEIAGANVDTKPVLKRLPDASDPHFLVECDAALRERQGHRRPPDRFRQDTIWVYFIGGDEGPIKIGMARCVQRRLAGIQGACPMEVRVLATRLGGRPLEKGYHAMFAASRLRGEWFERTPEILAEIDRLNAKELAA